MSTLGKFYCPYCFNWLEGDLISHILEHERKINMPLDLSNPVLQLALRDVEDMNTDGQWANLIVNVLPTETIIKITYGVKHHGEREQAIGTRHYYFRNGEPMYYTLVHP